MFFSVGLFMYFSPAFWPEQFVCNLSCSNTSEWWLLVMGMIQMAMGAWVAGINEVPRLGRYLANLEPVAFDFKLSDAGSTLSESFYAGLKEVDEISLALSLQRQLRRANG